MLNVVFKVPNKTSVNRGNYHCLPLTCITGNYPFFINAVNGFTECAIKSVITMTSFSKSNHDYVILLLILLKVNYTFHINPKHAYFIITQIITSRIFDKVRQGQAHLMLGEWDTDSLCDSKSPSPRA